MKAAAVSIAYLEAENQNVKARGIVFICAAINPIYRAFQKPAVFWQDQKPPSEYLSLFTVNKNTLLQSKAFI